MSGIARSTFIWFGMVLMLISAQSPARENLDLQDVQVDVISDERGALRQFPTRSGSHRTERSYVVAREDERYSVRIQNNTDETVAVVIAVDGRNVISGSRSYLGHKERMYILKPWQTREYSGWRTGSNRVNRFYFTNAGASYADAWDDHSAIGVIAVAVFRARQEKPEWTGKHKKEYSSRAQASRRGEEAGTGFGEEEWSPSRKVHFSPRKKPSARKFIKYEWRSSLCRKGIVDCPQHRRGHGGNRFWPDEYWRGSDDYAPYPRQLRHRE